VLYLREPDGSLSLRFGQETSVALEPLNRDVAQWVAGNSKSAGLGTDTLPSATALFVPLVGSQRTVGAVGVRPANVNRFMDPEQLRFLEACVSMIALAIERDASLLDAQQATLAVETEQLRNALLSSVSHDLRTPLASIAGSASGLAESFDALDPATRRELLDTITEESGRLARIVENLLHMTRLSSGRVAVDRQWQPVEDVIGSALNRMERNLTGRDVDVVIADGLPLGHFDEVLVELALINLIDNAVKYSPPGTPIEVGVRDVDDALAIEVADRGRGFLPGDEQQVFDLFYRGADAKPDRRGTGLGLAICKAIVRAHDGVIVARTRPEGGASIRFTLPYDGEPPRVEADGELTAPRANRGNSRGPAPR
jgi:two-component system, OmpR family, sensor histidine kinase KdpD